MNETSNEKSTDASPVDAETVDTDDVYWRKGDLHYPVKTWWVDILTEWMAQKPKERTQAWIARKVGCSRSTVFNIIHKVVSENEFIPGICRLVADNEPLPGKSLILPTQEVLPSVKPLLDHLMAMTPEQREEWIATETARLEFRKRQK